MRPDRMRHRLVSAAFCGIIVCLEAAQETAQGSPGRQQALNRRSYRPTSLVIDHSAFAPLVSRGCLGRKEMAT
jgi:hypothetical protein